MYKGSQSSNLLHYGEAGSKILTHGMVPHLQKNINILEQLSRTPRYVCNDYTTQTPGCVKAIVKDTGWESFQDRRYTTRLCLLCTVQHGLVDIEGLRYLTPSDKRTRGQIGLFQERINCDVYYNNPFFPHNIRDFVPQRVMTEANTLEEFWTSLASLFAVCSTESESESE